MAGANREGYHLRGVVPGRTFHRPSIADIHLAAGGDALPEVQAAFRVEKTIEIGNIFKLGTKYSAAR